MYADSSAYVRVKGGETGCTMSPWLVMGRRGVRFLEDGREWRLLGLLYADDLVLCGELEEDLTAMVGQFTELCMRRGLKVNKGKSKVMLLNGMDGLEWEVHVDWIHLEHVSEFKYLGCVLDESVTDGAECSRKVENGRRVVGAIRSLINISGLQLECDRVLHETFLVPVLMYGSETML